MKTRLSRFLFMLLLVPGLAWGCARGAGGGGGDTTTDAEDGDAGADVIPDGEDTPSDVPVETEPDIVGDTPDASVAIPFFLETSGGAVMTSPGHRLELFIGPVRPVGSGSSENYHFELGPAGIRGH